MLPSWLVAWHAVPPGGFHAAWSGEPTGGKRKNKPPGSIPGNIDVSPIGILVLEPGLEFRAAGRLCGGNSLRHLTRAAIENKYGDSV